MKRIKYVFLLSLLFLILFGLIMTVNAKVVFDDLGGGHVHKYSAATCTKPKTCTICGATSGSALGHNYGSWKTTKEATCISKGTEKRTCSRCKASQTRATALRSHSYSAATCTKLATCEWCGETVGKLADHSYSEATCIKLATCKYCGATKGGYAAHKFKGNYCTVCGTNHVHTFAYNEKMSTPATCTQKGKRWGVCTICNYQIEEETSALGHSYRAATCTQPATCTRCKATSGTALGHSYGSWVVIKEATCITKGTEKRTCIRCNVSQTRATALRSHSYSAATCIKLATCIWCGETAGELADHKYDSKGRCTVCGIVNCNHNWTSWTTTKEATCTATGTQKRTCRKCDKTETKTINKLEHEYSLTASKENITTKYHYVVCKRCGNTKQEEHNYYLGYSSGNVCIVCGYNKVVSTCQHEYKYVVTKAPTCTSIGKETGTCTKCSAKTTRDIPATQHNWTSWTTTKEATCTTTGIQKRTCRKCDKTETQIIKKLEHNYSKTYEYNKTSHYRKCNNPGCTQRLVQIHQFNGNVCKICGYNKEDTKPNVGNNVIPSTNNPPAVDNPTTGNPSIETPPEGENPPIETAPETQNPSEENPSINENLSSGENVPIEDNPMVSEFPSYEIKGYIISQNTSVKFGEPLELPRLNEKELEKIISNWLDKRFTKEKAKIRKDILNENTIKDIIKIQNNYNVSSIFMLAVATQETSMSPNSNTKNLFNVLDSLGDYKSKPKQYKSYKESFEDFAKILAEKEYYFASNNYTIEKIGNVYAYSDISKEWITNIINITAEIMNYYEPIEVKGIYMDVNLGDWYYDAVEYVKKEKLFDGIVENNFEPNKNMTRGLLVTILYRLSGAKTSKKAIFDDVDENAYYSNAIYWATNKGIVNGIGDNKFAPDSEITREDLSTIIERYIDKMKIKILNKENVEVDFKDSDEMSDYAKENVENIVKKGLMQGKSGNYFDPKGKATRAEVATILMRLDK